MTPCLQHIILSITSLAVAALPSYGQTARIDSVAPQSQPSMANTVTNPPDAAPLRAGTLLTWEFPQLANPLHTMAAGTKGLTKATVFLPLDYVADQQFPLVLFISGWDGQTGEHAGFSRMVVGDRGYICVGVPSFKAKLGPPEADPKNNWKRILITKDDASTIWSQYRTILERVFATIPNIDRHRTFFGGFSNGGHITAALLSHPDTAKEFLAYFRSFLLVDGGNQLAPAVPLAHTRFFLMQGGLHHEDVFSKTKPALEAAGATWSERVMEGVGHDFPETEAQRARAWVAQTLTE